MESPDLLALFVAPLEELELPYMVTGGVAAVLYGEARSGSDRHLRDVSAMIRVSPEELPEDGLCDWIAELGLEEEWSAAGEFVG